MKTTFTLLRSSIACVAFLLFSFSAFAEEDFSGLFCPDDVYVDCDEELWDLSIYGHAYYKDYGGTHPAGEPWVDYSLNSCNIGTITRTWKVTIYGTHFSCYQTIHVSGNGNFGYNDINWPAKHVDLTGCSPETDPYSVADGHPTWGYGDCNLLAMSYRDTYFTVSGTCDKIIREWTVLDWCVYDPYHNPYDGKYKYYQTIKIADEAIPEISCLEDIVVNSYNCKDAKVVVDPLLIDPSTCGGEFSIINNSAHADAGGNDISGVYPIGETTVKYTIKYGCGEVKTCTFKVIVKDSKAPTPYCYAYMAISLMGMDNDGDGLNDEGMAEVWAKDLDAGSYAHCVDGPLKYSFSADTSDAVRIFTCDQLGENEMQMWVTDALGNQSWCIVILDVQNNGADIQNCVAADDSVTDDDPEDGSQMFTLEGSVYNTQGAMISDIEITMTDMEGGLVINTRKDTSTITTYDTIFKEDGSMLIRHLEETYIQEISDTSIQHQPEMNLTDDNGQYSFAEKAAFSSNYKIQATSSDQEYAEIDIDDIEVLFLHLTRQSSLTSPYQYIAADVDGDGLVSFMDMRLMLMYYTEKINALPIGVSSVLVDAKAVFEDPALAISGDRPDFIMVNDVQQDENDLDFIQVVIGDLAEKESARKINNYRSQTIASEALLEVSEDKLIQRVDLLLKSDHKSRIGIYPNPFSERVNVVLSSNQEQYTQLEVYSLDGKLIKSEGLSLHKGENQFSVNMEELNNGIFIYRVKVDGLLETGKLVKK